jgi:hypothetical protein
MYASYLSYSSPRTTYTYGQEYQYGIYRGHYRGRAPPAAPPDPPRGVRRAPARCTRAGTALAMFSSLRLGPLATLIVASMLLATFAVRLLLLHCNHTREPAGWPPLPYTAVDVDGHQKSIPGLNPPQRTAGTVRLVMLSDTHTHHSQLDVPDGDILIHAGDYASARNSAGRLREKVAFDEWYVHLHQIQLGAI